MRKLTPPAPRLLPHGGTVLILGSGPSLTREDVALARTTAHRTIAVNDAYLYAPDADVLYACDATWWTRHACCRARHTYGTAARVFPPFTGGLRASLAAHVATVQEPDVMVFQQGPQRGLSLDPTRLATGKDSVYQAVNLAVHLGATQILLLGVDMQDGRVFRDGHWRPADHFWGHHPDLSKPNYHVSRKLFATIVEPLRHIGVEVINCTPGSALTCFPMRDLREVCALQATV